MLYYLALKKRFRFHKRFSMSTYKGFTTTQLQKPARSYFDLSHEKRISTRMGRLTPCLITETLPNDTFRGRSEMLVRLAPLLAPIMHRVNVFVHYFFVPNRLLWKDWETFITHGRLGTETPPVPPHMKIVDIGARLSNKLDIGSLFDYLGGMTITDAGAGGYGNRTLDIMPMAAHYKVWYDYYRDRNYVADNTRLPLASGLNVSTSDMDTILEIYKRDYQKDYFTSALPWTQRGDEVLMPLVGTGSVTYLPTSKVYRTDGAAFTSAVRQLGTNSGAVINPDLQVNQPSDGSSGGPVGRIENIDTVTITGSQVSVNDLRTAVALQKFYERQALAGSRMNETIWAHFNRRTSDGRLQRAEYLGGGKVTVKISEVVATNYSEDATPEVVPAGNMAGHGVVLDGTPSFTYNCEEWGFIIGILSVMPNTAYMQGTPRMFLGRNTFLDYPWPTFAHLGEQEVYKYELFGGTTNITEDRTAAPVFGYQSRYSDWKYIPSSSHGDFRTSLDFWHLTRKFASSPSLGFAFCTFEDALQDRIFAVSGVDTIWVYMYNDISVVRSLPYYGTPQL